MIPSDEGRAQPTIAGSEDEDKAQELEAEDSKDTDSTRQTLEDMQPCQHLDFSSARPISDSDLQKSKMINLYCLSH